MKYTNEIMLLMNDSDGDFLDAEHIKRFYFALSTNFNELLGNIENLGSNVYDLYYLYLISSFVTEDLIKDETVRQLDNILKDQKDQICIDENDILMVEIAHRLFSDLPFNLKTEDLIDDDFSKIISNVYLLDSEFSNAVSKMEHLLSIVRKSIVQGLFNLNDYSIDYYNDLSL